MCNRTKLALITRNDSYTCTYKNFYHRVDIISDPLIVLSSVRKFTYYHTLGNKSLHYPIIDYNVMLAVKIKVTNRMIRLHILICGKGRSH